MANLYWCCWLGTCPCICRWNWVLKISFIRLDDDFDFSFDWLLWTKRLISYLWNRSISYGSQSCVLLITCFSNVLVVNTKYKTLSLASTITALKHLCIFQYKWIIYMFYKQFETNEMHVTVCCNIVSFIGDFRTQPC